MLNGREGRVGVRHPFDENGLQGRPPFNNICLLRNLANERARVKILPDGVLLRLVLDHALPKLEAVSRFQTNVVQSTAVSSGTQLEMIKWDKR